MLCAIFRMQLPVFNDRICVSQFFKVFWGSDEPQQVPLWDIYEFMRAMKELGLGLTFEDAKALFSQIDVDGSGMMDEEEFTTHYINHIVKQRRG